MGGYSIDRGVDVRSCFFDCFRSFFVVFKQFLIFFWARAPALLLFFIFGRFFDCFCIFVNCFRSFLIVFGARASFYWIFLITFDCFIVFFGPGPLVGQAALGQRRKKGGF